MILLPKYETQKILRTSDVSVTVMTHLIQQQTHILLFQPLTTNVILEGPLVSLYYPSTSAPLEL